MTATCSNCLFGTSTQGGEIVCHNNLEGYGNTNRPDWWCSAHPLAPGQRDRIAEMAISAASEFIDPDGDFIRDTVAQAYAIADVMMVERAKGSK